MSGDCPNLNPQPAPQSPGSKNKKKLSPKDELESNKIRLDEAKKHIKSMKEQIQKFAVILRKEVGEEINLKELLRYGSSLGWQGRAQLILNLRLKLIAMRSKFLDPPHKMYYRGPFDPQKELDLEKILPQKQDNLHDRMLEEKRQKTMELQKPISVVQKELDDLSLMRRAARARTKSLVSKVKEASRELTKSKEKAEYDHRVVEAMMAHQSLFKKMVEPETFRLDPTLKGHAPVCLPEIPDWTKFKMSFEKSQKEKLVIRESVVSLTSKLDKINKNLIEAKKLDVENQLQLMAGSQTNSEIPTKDKQKQKGGKESVKDQPTDLENEYKLLVRENRHLRQFLLNSVLMTEEDFRLFVNAVDISKQNFIKALQNEKALKNS